MRFTIEFDNLPEPLRGTLLPVASALQTYTEKQAAEILQLPARTLEKMRSEGLISYSTIRKGRIRFTDDDIMEYVKRNQIQAVNKKQT